MNVTDADRAEIAKYEAAYRSPGYAMGVARKSAVARVLAAIPVGEGDPPAGRHSLLDVGCGRGETLRLARELGWRRVFGVEVVPALLSLDVLRAVAWDLPWGDRMVETVTALDMMEHLLEERARPTVEEFARVARRRIILTISNIPSAYALHDEAGGDVELHIHRRPYDEADRAERWSGADPRWPRHDGPTWDELLADWLPGWAVRRVPEGATTISECWEAVRQ